MSAGDVCPYAELFVVVMGIGFWRCQSHRLQRLQGCKRARAAMNCAEEDRANTAGAAGCGANAAGAARCDEAKRTMKGRTLPEVDMHGKALKGRMLLRAVVRGKTAKGEPEVAVCKKVVEGRRLRPGES